MSTNATPLFKCVAVALFAAVAIFHQDVQFEIRSIASSFSPDRRAVNSVIAPPKQLRQAIPANQAVIDATLLNVSFQPQDIQGRQFQAQLNVVVSFMNKTGKAIKSFEGTLTILDLQGNMLATIPFLSDQSLGTTDPFVWSGSVNLNQLNTNPIQLQNELSHNLKASFAAQKLLFDDETEQTF